MESQPEDDWSLLFAWRDGDQRSADQLAARYFPVLMRFFLNKVRNVDDAAELVSETFLGCSASKDRSERSGSFRSYLFAIAMLVREALKTLSSCTARAQHSCT